MDRQPNILWIGLDQIRFDTLGINGNTTCRTPNMDRLASGGVNFSRAYTTCSLCSPARASMFTGQYAFRHGMGTNCDMYHSLAAELARPEELLHHHFSRAGYSLGYAGKWHVGTGMGPCDYGFEGMNIPGYGNITREPEFLAYLEKRKLEYSIDSRIYANPGKQTMIGGHWNGPVESTPPYYLAERTMQMLDTFMERKHDDAGSGSRNWKPFFVTCQFWGPHGPHLPCNGFYGMHNRDEIVPWVNWEDTLRDKPNRIERENDDFYRHHPRTWEECRELVGLYYDATAMVDAQIGRLLDYLERRGLRDDTIVVLSTDHGDMTGSHRGQLDKGMLYEEAHHIPLIISWPGSLEATDNRSLAMNMDIIPTLMDMAGIPVPEGLDGTSLYPLISGRDSGDDRDIQGRSELYLEFHGLRFLYSQRAIVTEDNWKYIFTPGDYDEMYDLNSDPAEMRNLIDETGCREKRQELRERIRNVSARYNDPLRDCISKFFGVWDTGSGQVDATAFLK